MGSQSGWCGLYDHLGLMRRHGRAAGEGHVPLHHLAHRIGDIGHRARLAVVDVHFLQVALGVVEIIRHPGGIGAQGLVPGRQVGVGPIVIAGIVVDDLGGIRQIGANLSHVPADFSP